MPKYAALLYTEDLDWTAAEQGDQTKQYMEFGNENASVIAAGAALFPTSTGTTVRVRGGRGGDVVTSDGPYAESKEILGGFYLLEAADLDEAVRLAAQIPAAWGAGGVELRPVIEMRHWPA